MRNFGFRHVFACLHHAFNIEGKTYHLFHRGEVDFSGDFLAVQNWLDTCTHITKDTCSWEHGDKKQISRRGKYVWKYLRDMGLKFLSKKLFCPIRRWLPQNLLKTALLWDCTITEETLYPRILVPWAEKVCLPCRLLRRACSWSWVWSLWWWTGLQDPRICTALLPLPNTNFRRCDQSSHDARMKADRTPQTRLTIAFITRAVQLVVILVDSHNIFEVKIRFPTWFLSMLHTVTKKHSRNFCGTGSKGAREQDALRDVWIPCLFFVRCSSLDLIVRKLASGDLCWKHLWTFRGPPPKSFQPS